MCTVTKPHIEPFGFGLCSRLIDASGNSYTDL